MFWTKLLKRLSEDVNEHLLLQNELLKAQDCKITELEREVARVV